MDKQKSIEALQFFVTHLSDGAFVHKIQGHIFKSQGFNKLGDKYMGHYSEEMGWVEKFIDRILDLGGEVATRLTNEEGFVRRRRATMLIHFN